MFFSFSFQSHHTAVMNTVGAISFLNITCALIASMDPNAVIHATDGADLEKNKLCKSQSFPMTEKQVLIGTGIEHEIINEDLNKRRTQVGCISF